MNICVNCVTFTDDTPQILITQFIYELFVKNKSNDI